MVIHLLDQFMFALTREKKVNTLIRVNELNSVVSFFFEGSVRNVATRSFDSSLGCSFHTTLFIKVKTVLHWSVYDAKKQPEFSASAAVHTSPTATNPRHPTQSWKSKRAP